LDVVVIGYQKSELDAALLQLGYNPPEELDEDEFEYAHETNIPIHVVLEQDEPRPGVKFGPTCEPDYSVNLLALDKSGLFNWMDMSDPMLIVDQILSNRAYVLFPTEDRVEKFKSYGFEIMPKRPISSLETRATYYEDMKQEISENIKKIEQLTTKRLAIEREIEEMSKKRKLLQDDKQNLLQDPQDCSCGPITGGACAKCGVCGTPFCKCYTVTCIHPLYDGTEPDIQLTCTCCKQMYKGKCLSDDERWSVDMTNSRLLNLCGKPACQQSEPVSATFAEWQKMF
jgi:hypothetical protein